jgi:hypothetical protein
MRDRSSEALAASFAVLAILLALACWRLLYVTVTELSRVHTMHQGTDLGQRINRLSLAWLSVCTVLALLGAVFQLVQPFVLLGALATCAWVIAIELLDRQDQSHLAMPGALLAPWRSPKKAA